MITVSVSPLRRAIDKPLLVRVLIVRLPSLHGSVPSNTTSLSNLHHQAGRPLLSMRARTDHPVKACNSPAGPGKMHPLSIGFGGVKVRTLSVCSAFVGERFNRFLSSCVGDRRETLFLFCELRIRSKRRSSSERGFEGSVVALKPRLSSAGRCSRAMEPVRCGVNVDDGSRAEEMDLGRVRGCDSAVSDGSTPESRWPVAAARFSTSWANA